MAGRGRAPKDPTERRPGAKAPIRGEWSATPGVGWQHGPVPDPPPDLLEPSYLAWSTWFGSWFAARWEPGDVPALRLIVRLHDGVIRGRTAQAGELRMWLDTYGITPKGQQDRRWSAPKAQTASRPVTPPTGGRYAHLRAIPDDAS